MKYTFTFFKKNLQVSTIQKKFCGQMRMFTMLSLCKNFQKTKKAYQISLRMKILLLFQSQVLMMRFRFCMSISLIEIEGIVMQLICSYRERKDEE